MAVKVKAKQATIPSLRACAMTGAADPVSHACAFGSVSCFY